MGRDQQKPAVGGEIFDERFEERFAASFDFADRAEGRMNEHDLVARCVHTGEIIENGFFRVHDDVSFDMM